MSFPTYSFYLLVGKYLSDTSNKNGVQYTVRSTSELIKIEQKVSGLLLAGPSLIGRTLFVCLFVHF